MKIAQRLIAAAIFFCSLTLAGSARAEDLNAIFKRVDEFVAQKNYGKAMEELDWAKKEVEKMHVKRIQELLPDSLAGFTGQKFESNGILGFNNIERNYVQGKKTAKLSLTGGTGQGASAMAGFAQLGRMAAMMGAGGEGTDTIRVQGRTAIVETPSTGGNPSVTVMLDSGSILKMESSEGVSADQLKSMVDGIKIEELDSYLKGGK